MPIYALGDDAPDIHPEAYVHPDAVVIGKVSIGAESTVWPGAVLRGDNGGIVIGARTSIQDGTVIHCIPTRPTIVGDDCVIGHIVHLEGCTIEGGGVTACCLGDAYTVDPAVARSLPRPDVLFVTVGGFESNVENALRTVSLLRPRTVVPVHGETVFRTDAPSRELARRLAEALPDIRCVVPEDGVPFPIEKESP